MKINNEKSKGEKTKNGVQSERNGLKKIQIRQKRAKNVEISTKTAKINNEKSTEKRGKWLKIEKNGRNGQKSKRNGEGK